MGAEQWASGEEDDEVTPGPLFIRRVRLRRALTAHYRAVIGKARDRVRVSARLRGWWPHDRPHRGPRSGNRQPRIPCAGQRENRGVVGGQVGLALECAGALFGGSG